MTPCQTSYPILISTKGDANNCQYIINIVLLEGQSRQLHGKTRRRSYRPGFTNRLQKALSAGVFSIYSLE